MILYVAMDGDKVDCTSWENDVDKTGSALFWAGNGATEGQDDYEPRLYLLGISGDHLVFG